MPDVSGVPGGASPNQVGQFYVPPSEWILNPLSGGGSGGFSSFIVVFACTASIRLLAPWAGSNDEITIPLRVDDGEWQAPVLPPQRLLQPILGDNDDVVTPAVITPVDEEYNHKAPTTWPQQFVKLSWPDEDVVVGLQGTDGDEWIPASVPAAKLNSLLLWVGSDEVATPPPPPTIVDEEYPYSAPTVWTQRSVSVPLVDEDVVVQLQSADGDEWIPGLLPKYPSNGLVLWIGSDEISVSPPDETEWLPGVTRSSWLNPALGLVNTPQDEVTRITSADDEGWLPPLPKAPWQSSVVTDSNGDFAPQATIAFEEDSWIPQSIVTSTKVILLNGGTGPIPAAALVLDEDYKLWVSRNVISWYPRIVSDSTDYPVPPLIAFEEEPQSVTLISPFVVSLITPWSYGVGEDAGPTGPEETEWINPVRPVALKYDAQFVNRSDEVIFTILRVEDECWQPSILPLAKLVGQRIWTLELNEIVQVVIATPIIDEEFSYPIVIARARLLRYDQWVGEQHEIFTPAPPEVCIEGPASVTITVETPGGSVITLEGPMVITLASEAPAALGVTLEGASPLSLVREVPTETQCND